jgi:hypothetical protein
MSIKSKILAALATLTLVGGVGLAGAVSATAATPSCGIACINTYPQEYAGQSLNAPQNVLDTYRQGERVGQPIILFRSSNTDPAEDFTITGELSAAMAKAYGCEVGPGDHQFPSCASAVDDVAWQLQYAPLGVDSGLCMGVNGGAAFSGEKVALEPCGTTAGTVWIQDTLPNDQSPSVKGFWVAINGSGTQFSNPVVLTYPSGANPVDKPRVQLTVTNLGQFSNPNFDDDAQLWTAFTGVLP